MTPQTPGHDPNCRETLRAAHDLATAHPMPTALADQIGAWIAPHTISTGLPYAEAMQCVRIAYPLIREHLGTCAATPLASDLPPATATHAPVSDAELLGMLREPACTPAPPPPPAAPAYPAEGDAWLPVVGTYTWLDVLSAHKFAPLALGVRDALVRHGVELDRIELDGSLFPDQDDPRTRIEVRIMVPGQSGARSGQLTRTLVDKGAPVAVADLGYDEVAQSMITRLTVAEQSMPAIPEHPVALNPVPAAVPSLDDRPVFGQQPHHPLGQPAEPHAQPEAAPALDETATLGTPIPVASGMAVAAAPGQTWQL